MKKIFWFGMIAILAILGLFSIVLYYLNDSIKVYEQQVKTIERYSGRIVREPKKVDFKLMSVTGQDDQKDCNHIIEAYRSNLYDGSLSVINSPNGKHIVSVEDENYIWIDNRNTNKKIIAGRQRLKKISRIGKQIKPQAKRKKYSSEEIQLYRVVRKKLKDELEKDHLVLSTLTKMKFKGKEIFVSCNHQNRLYVNNKETDIYMDMEPVDKISDGANHYAFKGRYEFLAEKGKLYRYGQEGLLGTYEIPEAEAYKIYDLNAKYAEGDYLYKDVLEFELNIKTYNANSSKDYKVRIIPSNNSFYIEQINE